MGGIYRLVVVVRRRGVSPVVATVVLTGILLTTISVAIFYSTSLIDMNRQLMEYEYAKEQLTYAVTALEQVAFGAGGARYVRFSLTSTGLNFQRRPDVLEVEIYSGGAQPARLALRPARVAVCGGPLVTTVPGLLYPEGGSLDELGRLVVGAESRSPLFTRTSRGGLALPGDVQGARLLQRLDVRVHR